MRGEHRAHGEPVDEVAHLARRELGGADAFDGAGQPAALLQPFASHGPGAMHLFGDVGQMEVGAERPHQPSGRIEVDAFQQLGECVGVGPAQHAHPLDKGEQLLALLAHERLAEQVAEPADVGTQGG